MTTITILRYSAASTKAALLKEIANGASKDYGTGQVFDGTCCVVEEGQEFDVASLVSGEYKGGMYSMPNGYQLPGRRHQLNLSGAVETPSGLASYIATQGYGKRTMWRMVVEISDLVSTCGRSMGGLIPCYEADGVVLSRSAKPLSIAEVSL